MYCIAQRRVLRPLSEEDRKHLLSQAPLLTLVELLEAIPDPRGKHGLRYDLPYLLTCLIAALLCNCNSTEAVSQWCREHVELLRDIFGPRLCFTRSRVPLPLVVASDQCRNGRAGALCLDQSHQPGLSHRSSRCRWP